MKGRPYLQDDHWMHLQLIIDGKREPTRTQLSTLARRLGARFGEYEDYFDSARLAQLPRHTWKEAERDALLHCYDTPSTALSSLKTQIQLVQQDCLRNICPYCGVGLSDEFDHYAPKESFPHVAVHAMNLVPCCGRCNKTKSKAWLNADGERTVLHYYLDGIPDKPFLFASLSWSLSPAGRVPRATFQLERPKNYSKVKFALIERHYERMKLLLHYRGHAHRGFIDIRRCVRLFEPKTASQVAKLTHRYVDSLENDFGGGHWLCALGRALADDSEFAASLRE